MFTHRFILGSKIRESKIIIAGIDILKEALDKAVSYKFLSGSPAFFLMFAKLNFMSRKALVQQGLSVCPINYCNFFRQPIIF